MRVVHTIFMEEYEGNYPFSGAENHLFTLMEAQKKSGLDVVFAPVLYRSGPLLKQKLEELKSKGIEIKMVPAPKCLSIFNIPYLLKLAWSFRHERKSIIHTHLVLAEFFCKLASFLAGCRFQITSIHNDEPMFKKIQWKIVLRFLDLFTKHYITITHHVRSYMIRMTKIPSSKFSTVHYGVAYEEISETKESLRKELKLPLDKTIIGFVGRLNEQKNIPFLVEAAKHFPEQLFVLLGTGPLKEKIEKDLRDKNISNLLLLGHHPRAATYMKAFDIFCLPSKWEGLGLVLLEAMHAECPIIGSQAGAIPEILGQGQFGLVFKNDQKDQLESFFKNLKELIESPEKRTALGKKGKDHLLQDFTIEKMTNETTKLYEKIMGIR